MWAPTRCTLWGSCSHRTRQHSSPEKMVDKTCEKRVRNRNPEIRKKKKKNRKHCNHLFIARKGWVYEQWNLQYTIKTKTTSAYKNMRRLTLKENLRHCSGDSDLFSKLYNNLWGSLIKLRLGVLWLFLQCVLNISHWLWLPLIQTINLSVERGW